MEGIGMAAQRKCPATELAKFSAKWTAFPVHIDNGVERLALHAQRGKEFV